MPTWGSLVSNELVDESSLYDAVNSGVFVLNIGNTVSTGDICITATQASTWLKLDNNALPTDGSFPSKSQLIPKTITQLTTISNFASPSYPFAVGDLLVYDDPSLNAIIRFDPRTTLSGTASIQMPLGNIRPTGMYYHPPTNKLYINSFSGGGLIIVDCSAWIITNTIPYGTDGSYSRGNVYYITALDEIWAFGNSGFLRLSPLTETIVSTTSTQATGSIYIASANNKIYVFFDFNGNKVEVYDNSLTHLTTISGLLQNLSSSSTHVSRGYYTDSTNKKIYVLILYMQGYQ
jgi:hypothetical protein